MIYFPQYLHPPYPGNYTDLHVTNVDGYFAYTFAITNSNCSNVKAWFNDIKVNGEKYFQNGNFTCVHTGTPTSENENLIETKTTPPPTKTTATPLVIVPGGALPAAPLVIPYQSDYEETAEHVEELSSFESISIMNL
uniref:Uncharacterized protein n=1 Tax=Haemonchus contortus TaxID=6289 RepID=W6NBM3_HAECO